MFDKDNKFGFIINNNNENNNNIKNTDLPYTVSSKVLGTVPANTLLGNVSDNDDRLLPPITINNAYIKKDRRYYIEFLGSKKLCNLLVNEEQGNCIMCSIGNYGIQAFNVSTNILVRINKINTDDTTTDTFTDLVIYEEEVKYLDNKYIENDLQLQNSISLGRIGDIGAGSSAIGNGTTASGSFSHAEGNHTTASSDSSHAEGSNTIASGVVSHAEGDNTTASGDYGSHAEGSSTKATGMGSHAEGSMAISSGLYSHAEGNGTTASGSVSHAEGDSTKAIGICSHVEGDTTIASGDYQHVQGKYNIEDTANKYAHIVGNGDSDKKRANAHTLDWKGNAWYAGQVEGTNLPYTVSETTLFNITVDQLNKAYTESQSSTDTSMYVEVPNFTIKDNTLLFIEINNKRYRLDSVYTEELTKQNKTRVIMEFFGINDTVNNIGGGDVQTFYDKTEEYNENVALMVLNRINDNKPPVFTGGIKLFEISINKFNTLLLGKDVDIYNSLSIRRDPNSKIGEYSTAMGCFTIASGNCSHAEGLNTTASGDYGSHAEGKYTTASADNSHAEGHKTKASGTSSHAEGWYTIASSYCSHAEGFNAISSGLYSHAEGNGTTASGENSHAEGKYTKASSINQHVQGKYNIEDTANKYAHIVGNGDSDKKRANAHTLDWEGNAWYAGKLTQEGTPTEDKDLVTKKYVDDSIPIRSFPVNDTTRTGAVVDVNNLTVSGRYVLPKRTDGKQWTNLMMRAMINDGSGKGKSLLLSGYQNFIFYVNIENKKIYCDNLRIVYSIGTTDNTTDIRTEPYYLTTTNTKEYTPTNDYHPTTKKYVDDKVSSLPQLSFNENGELVVTINGVSKTFIPKSE